MVRQAQKATQFVDFNIVEGQSHVSNLMDVRCMPVVRRRRKRLRSAKIIHFTGKTASYPGVISLLTRVV